VNSSVAWRAIVVRRLALWMELFGKKKEQQKKMQKID